MYSWNEKGTSECTKGKIIPSEIVYLKKSLKVTENKVVLQNTSVLMKQQFQMEITQIKFSSSSSTYSALVERQHQKHLFWAL